MKYALALILFLSTQAFAATEYIVGTMTVTNGAVIGDGYGVSGSARSASSNRTSTTWITNASPMVTATNIYNQFLSWPVAGVRVSWSASNVIQFSGIGTTLSASNFAVITLATNDISAPQWTLQAPASALPNSQQVSNGVEIVKFFQKATNGLPEGTVALSNYPSLTFTQRIANKVATNFTIQGGSASNTALVAIPSATISNLTSLSGSFSNAQLINATGSVFELTLVNAGNGTTLTNTSGNATVLNIDNDSDESANGINFRFKGILGWSISVATNEFNISSGSQNFIAVADGSLLLSDTGQKAWVLADVTEFTGAVTNLVVKGTNQLDGSVAVTAGTYTSLVDAPGVNKQINLTRATMELSGGSAVTEIHGFNTNSVGIEVLCIFSGAVSNVLVNNSGSEGTTANRIKTGTGGNIVQTNQPAWARFRKRSTDWLLLDYSR